MDHMYGMLLNYPIFNTLVILLVLVVISLNDSGAVVVVIVG